MSLALTIDCRERQLIECLDSVHVPHETKNILIGDIQFECNESVVLVIERKTCADLLASVRDGRYTEQKKRALSNLGNNRYLYILEGVACAYSYCADKPFCGYSGTEARTIQTCIINMMVRDGVRIFYTQDVSETAALVKGIMDRAITTSDPTSYFRLLTSDGSCAQPNASYKATLQVKRKDNMSDPRTIAELQIAQVPSVSVTNAEAILDQFKVQTLVGLAYAVNALPTRQARVKALMEVPKIGKKKAETLLDALFPDM